MTGDSFYAELRERMIVEQIVRRGIADPKVLQAMRVVPRHLFVPEPIRIHAYDDEALPIGNDQTISQPYIVALMTEALLLEGGERVLEIGTGSGYAAAVLSCIAGKVYTIERISALAVRARATLKSTGYDAVEVIEGDGTLGWPQAAPYDAIMVTAAGPRIPMSLHDQLAPGGRLVMPVGADLTHETLVRLTRDIDGNDTRELLEPVRFVPLLGAEGWPVGA